MFSESENAVIYRPCMARRYLPKQNDHSLDLDGYKGLAGFRYALRQFLAASETIAGGAGVTARQYQALLAIKGFPGREQVTIGVSST